MLLHVNTRNVQNVNEIIKIQYSLIIQQMILIATISITTTKIEKIHKLIQL